MELLIACKNREVSSHLKDQLHSISSGIITMDSVDTLSTTLNDNTPVLILHEDFFQEAFSHLGTVFLTMTPCLLLVESMKNIPEFISPYDNVDIIESSAPKLALQKKISHLLYQKSLLQRIHTLKKTLADTKQSMRDNLDILDSMAMRDGLTGLYNRRHFSKILTQLYNESKQEKKDLALLIIDIDYFSQVNKNYGHDFGDLILNEIAARITTIFDQDDMKFRSGGQDFSILLADTNIEVATKLANQFRSICSEKPFTDGKNHQDITVSIGCTSIGSSKPRNQDELVTMAEMALFSAKSSGRDRVICYHNTVGSTLHDSQRNFLSLKNNLVRIFDKTKSSTISSLQLLAQDIGGESGRLHTENVNFYIQLLCKDLKIPEQIIPTFDNAIALHSSIRYLLHNEIISKKSSLNKVEKDIIQEFPYRLLELTELFDYFANERAILLSYGEHFDGSGFPDGLKGDEIPLGARMFNIIDSFAAMNADRPHRNKLSPKHILDELRNGAGKQFDPFLVHKTLDIIKHNNLLDVDPEVIDNTKNELSQAFPKLFI